MAFKTVVTNGFFQQVIKFLRSMQTTKGDFALALLVPSESGLSDKWNLVLSGRWIDDDGLQAVIPTITAALRNQLSKMNASRIDRVSVLRTTDPLVADLRDLDIAPGTAYRVQSLALTTRGLDEAIVLTAQRPTSSPNRQAQPIRTRA
jgi:hypothetical protein